MAKIGWKAHKDLLAARIHPNEGEREEKLQKILERIKEEDKLDDPDKETLGKPIEEVQIEIHSPQRKCEWIGIWNKWNTI